MRRLAFLLILLSLITMPVSGMDYTAPEAPNDALELMPVESSSFGKDLWTVFTRAIGKIQPNIKEAVNVCICLLAGVMLTGIVRALPGKMAETADFVAVLSSALLLLESTRSMVILALDTVTELSEYGKLLLPVMAAALASQGGITTSSTLYAGTAIFDTLLSTGIAEVLAPMLLIFLILSIAYAATGESMLQQLRDLVKWLVTWCFKMVLTVFTAYISVTGVVSGATDAATLKATKLTISGMVPVVGGILSDASEAVIVGAGVMKNAVGVYGMVALTAIWIAPFLQIGIQYLLLKLTAGLCGMFSGKRTQELVNDFSSAMGLLLGMTGASCLMLMISMVCFMKGAV